MAKSKEPRIPATIRIKPSLLKATRVAAAKQDQMHVDWVEGAFVAALHPDNRKVEMR